MPIHQIRFGPFSIEDEPIRLKRGADPVQLRPKSLEVLKYLAERPGQLVSKEELLKRVWASRVIATSSVVVASIAPNQTRFGKPVHPNPTTFR